MRTDAVDEETIAYILNSRKELRTRAAAIRAALQAYKRQLEICEIKFSEVMGDVMKD